MNAPRSTSPKPRFVSALGIGVAALAVACGLVAAPANVPLRPSGWKEIGPGPASVEAAIAVDAPSNTIYIVGIGGSVLKSTDGGAKFAAVDNGLTSRGATSMAMFPRDPNVVYLGTGDAIFKTTDGAAVWSATTGIGAPLSMAIDPNDSNVVYAGYNGFIDKTVDGGDTWVSVSDSLGGVQVFSLAIDPAHSNVVYAGTTGQGAFKSSDGGASWVALTADTTVWCLLVDPSDSNVVYAGSNGNGVFKSSDAGASFVRIGSPEVGVVLSLAKSGNRLFAGTATRGVSVSGDGGATWTNTGISEGLGLVLAVDSDGAVYAGTNFDGVFQLPASRLAGDLGGRRRDWRRLAWPSLSDCNCQSGHAIVVDPSNSRHVFLSTNDGGLLVTDDGGRTWRDGGKNGLVNRAPRGVAFDPREPRRVYAGSFTGGGLFKSEDHGNHWERRLFGSASIYVTGIDVDPVDGSIYVATVRSGDGIWKSTDFGETFTRIDRAPGAAPDDFLSLSGRGITVDPHRHRTVYFADRGTGIWRSQDAGASWINVDPNPSFKVTVDPVNSDIVYGAGDSGVVKSTDGGASFVDKGNGLDGATTSRTGALVVNPNRRRILYVGTEGGGVFKSTDAGENWFPVDAGLDDGGVYGLAMDPSSPDTLYASTASSVYKTTTGGQ
ncbi:MAG TPA: hypothetical protein VMN82_10875 [Thermoanaerobaculia bacterium]|nr:hypothetical protein [Thermoanaerobaculia bacterium]